MLTTMPTRWKTRTRRGFTLAELLVVIAIIGIMFLIALPIFGNLAGQSKLEAAANKVHSAAKLARQYARANNQPTFIVFHNADTTADTDLQYRSFAVFSINVHTPVIPVPQDNGYYISEWEILPEGVVFDINAREGTRIDNVFISGGGNWEAGFGKRRKLNIQGKDYTVLGFKPKGLQNKNYINDIFLTEGFYGAGGNLVAPTPRNGARVRVDNMGDSRITDIVYDEEGAGYEELEP